METLKKYLAYSGQWLLRYLWVIVIALLVINTSGYTSLNFVLVALVISITYINWKNHENGNVLPLFARVRVSKETLRTVTWMIYAVELIAMVAACFILDSGLKNITGVSERIFGISWLPLSTIFAVIITLGLFSLLIKISTARNNTRYILYYLVLDLTLVMIFNYMTMFESQQQNRLAKFYAARMITMKDNLNMAISSYQSESNRNYAPVARKNERIDADIAVLKRDKMNEENRLNDTTLTPELRGRINANIRNIQNRITRLEGSKDAGTDIKLGQKDYADNVASQFNALLPALNDIRKTRNDEKYFKNVDSARDGLLNILGKDSVFAKRSDIAPYLKAIQITPESPTDALNAFFTNMFSFASKEPPKEEVGIAVKDDLQASSDFFEAHWETEKKQIRLISYLIAISIDLVPLLLAISLNYFTRKETVVA